MSVDIFIDEWNSERDDIVFTLIGGGTPSSIEVRFSPRTGVNYAEKWEDLCDDILLRSHFTVIASSGKEMFNLGILDLKIASQKYNYEDDIVVGILLYIAVWLDTTFQ